MAKPINLAGQRFGRLTVLELAPREQWRWAGAEWKCRCECGNTAVVQASLLRLGGTRSCGCLRRERAARIAVELRPSATHNLSHSSPTYIAWKNMKRRCYNKNAKDYPRWGGRGIEVCERWRTDFEAFYADMGERPSPQHSLDRIDNNGDYEPGNCRWATAREQRANQRRSRSS